MTRRLPLSVLASLIQETVEEQFGNTSFWIIAEITDVKKIEARRWCFLKFIEKNKDQITTEMQGVFWANGYQEIENFEAKTQQAFANGLEVSCRVVVKFHGRYGLKLEVQEIDPNYTLGQMELQRQQTLDRLLRHYTHIIQLIDGEYISANKQLEWPPVLQRVALIAAPDSDGQRDFVRELLNNHHGYSFYLTEFAANVQGQHAVPGICAQLDAIKKQNEKFDVVAIVRGGGSQTDLTAFDDYEVAWRIAAFPIPVFTGIGHDRNTSIADLMGWQWRTPTKAAAAIVQTAHQTAQQLVLQQENINSLLKERWRAHQQQLVHWNNKLNLIIPHRIKNQRDRLKDLQQAIGSIGKERIRNQQSLLHELNKGIQQTARNKMAQQKLMLKNTSSLVQQLSPESILNRGFALVMQADKIITNIEELQTQLPLQTQLKNTIIISNIKDIQPHE